MSYTVNNETMPEIRKKRDVMVYFRTTSEDDDLYKKAAKLDERDKSDWIRTRLNRIASKECGRDLPNKKTSAS